MAHTPYPTTSSDPHSESLRFTAVTCVKNEGPFLLEWIAYHRVIGVQSFVFYSNDCDDGTDILLDHLANAGIVIHLENPAQGRHYQMEALRHAQDLPVIRKSHYVLVTDVDEFLNIKIGQGTLPELLAACGTPEAVSIPFQYFGNGGVDDFIDRPIIEQFTLSENPDLHAGERFGEVKTLTHYKFPLKYYGAHRPFMNEQRMQNNKIPHWTDSSGRHVSNEFARGQEREVMRKLPLKGARDFASLHHYALRSKHSYLVKHARGDVNRAGRKFETAYWQERNDCAYEDRSILRHLDAMTREIAALKSLPHIAQAHEACVAAHIAKGSALRQSPQGQELWHALSAHDIPTQEEIELMALMGGAV